jgi:hypothetical protein
VPTIQLSLPPAAQVSVSITYTAATGAQVIPLTDAQTYDVDLAMMPTAGLQALLVSVDAVLSDGSTPATDPVRVNLTPGGYVMVPPGGGLGIAAPGTAAGVTGLQLVSTESAVVRVSAYG